VKLFFLLAAFGLVSCGSPETLRVRQFHLQDTEISDGHPFIRAEMSKRLYGAVTLEERNLRRGNYYHLHWRGLSGKEPVRVVFDYRQARTASRIMTRKVEAGRSKKGECEIVVNGLKYLRDGHVSSWRVRLYEGDKLVGIKKSFLWE
jgi:hypothetical protein